ncbi:hypothetical protein C0993_007896 [Termitomyces sp. T159_Od127]|nr:hypothetical protein C0993_007896 [Termitomyces sp. T159_Od127]
MEPDSSIKPPCLPMSEEMLVFLKEKLDLVSSLDMCIYFTALMCFWAQIQLGKFLPKAKKNVNDTLYPKWLDFKSPGYISLWILHLPNTKMGGAKSEDMVVARQIVLDPINAMY